MVGYITVYLEEGKQNREQYLFKKSKETARKAGHSTGVANQSETESNISYSVSAKSRNIIHMGTHGHHPNSSLLTYILLLG